MHILCENTSRDSGRLNCYMSENCLREMIGKKKVRVFTFCRENPGLFRTIFPNKKTSSNSGFFVVSILLKEGEPIFIGNMKKKIVIK